VYLYSCALELKIKETALFTTVILAFSKGRINSFSIKHVFVWLKIVLVLMQGRSNLVLKFRFDKHSKIALVSRCVKFFSQVRLFGQFSHSRVYVNKTDIMHMLIYGNKKMVKRADLKKMLISIIRIRTPNQIIEHMHWHICCCMIVFRIDAITKIAAQKVTLYYKEYITYLKESISIY
jgi:hypothetical protein